MNRPIGLTILAVAHFLIGGFLFLSAISILFIQLFPDVVTTIDNNFVDVLPSGYGIIFNMMILLLISVVVIVSAIGILQGWSWIWYVEVLLSISLFLNIAFLSVTSLSTAILLILPIGLIYYLHRPNVKDFFFTEFKEEDLDIWLE